LPKVMYLCYMEMTSPYQDPSSIFSKFYLALKGTSRHSSWSFLFLGLNFVWRLSFKHLLGNITLAETLGSTLSKYQVAKNSYSLQKKVMLLVFSFCVKIEPLISIFILFIYLLLIKIYEEIFTVQLRYGYG